MLTTVDAPRTGLGIRFAEHDGSHNLGLTGIETGAQASEAGARVVCAAATGQLKWAVSPRQVMGAG